MIHQDRKSLVEIDEVLRKAAVKYADNISSVHGDNWVQVWEHAYDEKIKELRSSNKRE